MGQLEKNLQSLKLNSKDKACRFPPAIFQIAHSIFIASGAAFKELNSLLPIFPGIRTLQSHNKKTRVRDGKKSVPYQQRKTTKKGRGRLKEKGYLQVDGMKLKHGVVFNSMTGKLLD